MVPCRALVAAVLLRAATAMKVVEDPEDGRIMEGERDDLETGGRSRRRRTAGAGGPPTRFPSPAPTPTPDPTPEPTFVKDLPGVPCLCHKPACFEQFDLNNDTCIDINECNLQWFLAGNCSSTASSPAAYEDGTPYGPPVWDLDGDGCLNYTEWGIIYDVSNGSVCPQPPPEVCDECPPGKYAVPNPCECVDCNGDVRRRRGEPGPAPTPPATSECTPCEAPYIKDTARCPPGEVDECCKPFPGACVDLGLANPVHCPVDPNAEKLCKSCGCGGMNMPCENGSACVPVKNVPIPVQCDAYTLGDKVTLSGTVPGDPDTIIYAEVTVTGVTPILGGFVLDVDPCLEQGFSPIGGDFRHKCGATDGTEMSFYQKYSANYDDTTGYGCCCECGAPPNSECCDSTQVCTVDEHGTGVCSPNGPNPVFSTPAPTVGARGDPHLVNLQGEHFDINHDGKFTLLRFPQAVEKPAEFTFVADIQPDFGKPCTTYITEAEFSGAWLGSKVLQIRSYRKSHSNDTDAFLGARILLNDKVTPPWQTIEEFETNIELSEFGVVQSFLEKATWFPKKRSKKGPIAAGMFTLSLKNMHSGTSSKITIRQDLPEQEHLNVAVKQLSQLGRVDVGGLLGFDTHPESLERPSAACAHHKATARYRIESQDTLDHGYYFRPAWKDRWDKARGKDSTNDNEAVTASLVGTGREGGTMCKCSSDDSDAGSLGGVLVEEASFVYAEASWE